MRRPAHFLSTLATATALALMSSGSARADDKAACVAASDQGQTLRDEGKYRAARVSLVECARDTCPNLVRRDCEKWLNELDMAQPTLVLGARDPKGNDVAGTRVVMDGALLEEHLDGRPVAVDPGEHVFRYEAPGAASVEQRVVVRVNEKNRTLTAILMQQAQPPSSSAVAASSGGTAAASSSEPPAEAGEHHAATSTASWVAGGIFAGVTVLAGGSFAFFGLSGENDVSNLRASCAPNCSLSQVNDARTKLNVADVSLGVGVVSLGLATYFFIRASRAPKATSTAFNVLPDFEARPGGGVATVQARF